MYSACSCVIAQGSGDSGGAAAVCRSADSDRLDSSVSRHDVYQLVRPRRTVSRACACALTVALTPSTCRSFFSVIDSLLCGTLCLHLLASQVLLYSNDP